MLSIFGVSILFYILSKYSVVSVISESLELRKSNGKKKISKTIVCDRITGKMIKMRPKKVHKNSFNQYIFMKSFSPAQQGQQDRYLRHWALGFISLTVLGTFFADVIVRTCMMIVYIG